MEVCLHAYLFKKMPMFKNDSFHGYFSAVFVFYVSNKTHYSAHSTVRAVSKQLRITAWVIWTPPHPSLRPIACRHAQSPRTNRPTRAPLLGNPVLQLPRGKLSGSYYGLFASVVNYAFIIIMYLRYVSLPSHNTPLRYHID